MAISEAGKPVDGGALAGLAAAGSSPIAAPDAFRGEARFAIPIAVPAGTGESTPGLALRYRSAGGDGEVGVGWALDLGPALVARSTGDGAPHDDATDTFELGGERLHPLAGVIGRYASERFDHARIDFVGGTHWRVLEPDGTQRYYGYHAGTGTPTNESRLDTPQVLSVAPTQTRCPDPWGDPECAAREVVVPAGIPFAWYLDRIEDRNGNVIRLRWDDLGDAGMRYLVAIEYTSHVSGATGSTPSFGGADDGSLARSRRIDLDYEARPDALPTFRTGFRRVIGKRLAQIDVSVDGSLLRRYLLDYDQSPASGRSRLVRVEERGADGDAGSAFVHDVAYNDGASSGWSAKDSRWALPAGLTFLDGARTPGSGSPT